MTNGIYKVIYLDKVMNRAQWREKKMQIKNTDKTCK